MFTLKVGDWVIPTEGLLPIDSEQRGKAKKPLQITTAEPLQIESVPIKKEGEEQLKFCGIRGQFLACFFKSTNQATITIPGNDQKEQNIRSIISAHNVHTISASIEVEIVLDKRTYTLLGSKETMIDMSLVTVEMLNRESTPENYISSGTAPEEFERAAKKLITEGSKFYTVLRSSWALPALSWEICP